MKTQIRLPKWVLCLPILLFGIGNAIAQEHTVEGTVVEEGTGEPLPGVNIYVEESPQTGTTTDGEGHYTLTLPGDQVSLVYSFVGFESTTVPVEGRTQINLELSPMPIIGDELVLVGYGIVNRDEVTSSISSISADNFNLGYVRDAAELIQGQSAGLNVTTPTGDPTASAEISLRGVTTLAASSAPLVLIDGVPGSLESVAPEDIESVNILKDGSAAAIYGTRGSNGVIQITTRRGIADQPPRLDYSGSVSLQTIYNRPDMLSADEYRTLRQEAGIDFTDYGGDTDWQREILRDRPVGQIHNLTVSGGREMTTYSATLNYRNTDGIFIGSDDERITGRMNINHSMLDGRLVADGNIVGRRQNYADDFSGYAYRQAIIRNPTDFPRDENGNWIEREGYFYENPVANIRETSARVENRELRLNGTLRLGVTDDLEVSLLGSSILESGISGWSQSHAHHSNVVEGMGGQASRNTSSVHENLLEITADYVQQFGVHDINLLAGYSFQQTENEGFYAYNRDFPTDLFTFNSLEAGDGLTTGEADLSSYRNSHRLIGFFGRVNYNLNQRYLLMASLRYEGDSRFGSDNQWGAFPAASFGWRISNEEFMQEVDFISNLMLRAGFGVTGIAPDTPYLSLTSFTYANRFYNNGRWIQAISPARNPNPDLRWERKEEYNIGADISVLDDRLRGSFDIYRRDTRDMLWNYSVPVPPYLYGNIMANVGHIRNEGIEFSLEGMILQSDRFLWNTNINFSTNRNELVSLSDELYETTNEYIQAGHTGEPIQQATHRNFIGGPVGDFYGWKSVDITDDGEWIIENEEGVRMPISESSTADRQVLGNGIPNYYLSWNHTFHYRSLDVRINMRGAFDYQVLNFQRMYYENPADPAYNHLTSAYDLVYGKARLDNELVYVSHYVEDADFWKIDNITIGYSFNLDRWMVDNARVYITGQNLLTITGYKGMDPEVSISGLDPGNDHRDKFPTTRTFTLGINLTF